MAASVPVLIAAVAVIAWLRLPADYVLGRSLRRPSDGEQLLTLREGVTDVIAVTEVPGRGRGLITNGHPMSSTALLDQRYMRALAHIPLLSMTASYAGAGHRLRRRQLDAGRDAPSVALNASTSPTCLATSSDTPAIFATPTTTSSRIRASGSTSTTAGSISRCSPTAAYDLITLEPPPIAHAGVGGAVLARVLRAGAHAPEAGRLSQPVAARLPGAAGDEPGDGARVRRRLSAVACCCRAHRPNCCSSARTAPRSRSIPERVARALERAPDVRGRPAAPRSGHA